MKMKKHYWGYRICNEASSFFYEELKEGRLRQGWGYNSGQDLRCLTYDEGARKNLRMFEEVKKGDILLVPRIPSWEDISIVEATKDWNEGYTFDIPKEYNDFGHVFPARFIKSINRYSPVVSDAVRSTFHCVQRFWSMDTYCNSIENIIKNIESEPVTTIDTCKTSTPNIFDFATSELSQDAFLLWMLNWANPENKEYDDGLHETAQKFVRMLLGKDDSFQIKSVRTYKQLNNIDVFAIINKSLSLIIEDKVNTGTHDNQLQRYKEWVFVQSDFKNLELSCVYLKTGNESLSYLKRIRQEEEYNIILRKDIIEILRTNNSHNNIVVDFYNHLTALEKSTNSFKELKVDNWSWDAWQGFYMELEQRLEINVKTDAWFYVSNPNGGFLGFCWHWRSLSNCRIYLQFEQGPLCIKIECYEELNRSNIRNYWSEKVLEYSKDVGMNDVVRPNRFGNGAYMTIAIVPTNSLFGDNIIDMNRIISYINKIERIIDHLQSLN